MGGAAEGVCGVGTTAGDPQNASRTKPQVCAYCHLTVHDQHTELYSTVDQAAGEGGGVGWGGFGRGAARGGVWDEREGRYGVKRGQRGAGGEYSGELGQGGVGRG